MHPPPPPPNRGEIYLKSALLIELVCLAEFTRIPPPLTG